ncbi:hypothetical protein HN695_06010 [Candidatus Woesearchaeota archaeon]|jgi:hypothetical protein|nr:hypothetical protein [Candidatus Woesearchaeota archaeon]MBT5272673.1 hypothetical protein [Candidatus Woesearchaeota archaeon]MBT6041280.1 hypothetical protein [Candidatus Woesearchaeota archaeon]MBT6337082.1 hypothetical protein [Candidatus Woesearchaeota archaeon]MBT7927864.1 hypothetical protein [Candidatus Woesearchaeota archaeon]
MVGQRLEKEEIIRLKRIEVPSDIISNVNELHIRHGDEALRHELVHCMQVAEFAYEFLKATTVKPKTRDFFGSAETMILRPEVVSIAGLVHDIQNSLTTEGTFALVPEKRMLELIPESKGKAQWRMDDYDNTRMIEIVRQQLGSKKNTDLRATTYWEVMKILELGARKLNPKQVSELQKENRLYRVAHKVGDGVAFGMGNIQRMCEAVYMADIVKLYINQEATLKQTTTAIDSFHNKYLTQYDNVWVDGKIPVQLPFDKARAEKVLAKKNFPFKMDDLKRDHESVYALIHDAFTSNKWDEENRSSHWYDHGFRKAVEALRQAKTHDQVKDVSAITERLNRALEVVQRYAQRQYRLEGQRL